MDIFNQESLNAYIDMQRQRAASISFLELCNQYIHSRPDRNRDHLKGLENTRDRFLSLHAKMVSDATHRDLEPLLAPISPGGRNLIMRHLRAFFNFGIKKKIFDGKSYYRAGLHTPTKERG